MPTQTKPKKKMYIPSAFLVIIGLMLLFILISWIGYGATDTIKPIGLLDVFPAIWHGVQSKVDIILFIFAIGGVLGVLTKIKAIDAGIDALVNKLGDKVIILIPVLMLIFGLGGTTYGMWEETIAFIPVLIPVFKKAKFGPFTAILVILIGAGTGCLASTINPFSTGLAVDEINNVLTAEGAATVTPGVMQGSRWLTWVIFEIVAISLVTFMAIRFRSGKAVVNGLDNHLIEERFKEVEDIKFTIKRKISVSLFILGFVLMIILYLPWGDWLDLNTQGLDENGWFLLTAGRYGDAFWASIGNWYFVSVSSLFLMVALIVFAMNWRDFKSERENAEEGFINEYMTGVKDMVSVSLLIAVASGLGQILTQSEIGPQIANSISDANLNWYTYGILLFVMSLILSILVPSTSGFAGAFMGIFAQIGFNTFGPEEAQQFAGIAILAFLFASGIANLITPTSAALMGYTQYAGVPYPVWIKQTWKITVTYLVLSLVLIVMFSGLASAGSLF